MGLDMYLYLRKEEYTSKSEFRNKDMKNLYPSELKGFEEDILNRNFASRSIKTDYQIGYWRKANAIHKWFVDNCADGEDDCTPVYVPVAKLKELRNLCSRVLQNKSKANELLQTEEGFFFGTTEYDDWYFRDLEYTKQLLDKVITFVDGSDYEVIYQASW